MPKIILGVMIFLTFPTFGILGRWGDDRSPSELLGKDKRVKLLAVITSYTACPLAKELIPDLNALQRKFQDKGAQLVVLFPNATDDLSEIADYALENELELPIYKDDASSPWHEELGMSRTPEVVVLDTREDYDPKKILYQGKVDDRWSGGGGSLEKGFLERVLEEFTSGQKVTVPSTKPSGCPIAKAAPRDLSAYKDVTYYKDIQPLIDRRCRSCHTPGEPGAERYLPFEDYASVAGSIDNILIRVENRVMPPWHGYPGNKNIELLNTLTLTEQELDTLRAWRANGMPAGNAGDYKSSFNPPSKEWRIGKPDFIFQMEEPYIVPKERLDEYQFYRIKANFPEDRYIQAIESRPGNTAVVHHMGAIVGPASDEKLTGTDAMVQLYGLTGDKVKKIGDYVAGDPFNARVYPQGTALLLQKNSDLVFEMHYTPTGGDEQPDVSALGIIWAKEKPEHVIETHVFNRKDIRLKPHDQHYVMNQTMAFPTDVLIYALAPHMHGRGKAFKLYKITNPKTPQEKRELILKVPLYDPAWQRTYEFKKPIALKAGDALYGIGYFDNSHFNPNNPDPNQFTKYGILTAQEMFNMRVKFERVKLGD